MLSSLAVLLIVLGLASNLLQPARQWLSEAAYPFYWLANTPSRLAEWTEGILSSRKTLMWENQQLTAEVLVLRAQQLRMAELAAENVRLRHLLNATELLKDKVLVTELTGISPDPLEQEIIIDRGKRDAVYQGQPVLDAYGLMGQVVEVFENHSRVLLITDKSHALPVQVLRNGVRSIAEGNGDYRHLRLRYVATTMDIRVGDVLVSSGLGDRYPVGYPVGEVINVDRDPGKPFLEVVVESSARLDRSRHLLLVFTSEDEIGAD